VYYGGLGNKVTERPRETGGAPVQPTDEEEIDRSGDLLEDMRAVVQNAGAGVKATHEGKK
jgi:hypothetical protein